MVSGKISLVAVVALAFVCEACEDPFFCPELTGVGLWHAAAMFLVGVGGLHIYHSFAKSRTPQFGMACLLYSAVFLLLRAAPHVLSRLR